jgi:hypothetical protein
LKGAVKMQDTEKGQIIARTAVKFTASRLARIEARIVRHGLQPDTAADLWLARWAAAHAQARLVALDA